MIGSEFSPSARRLIMFVALVPACILGWFAFTILKPVYFSALDTTILPKSMTAPPAASPAHAAKAAAKAAAPPKVKRPKGSKRKAAGAEESRDAAPGKTASSSGKAKAPKGPKGEEVPKPPKGEDLGIGKETYFRLDSDPSLGSMGICGGAPAEFLPSVTMLGLDDCDAPASASRPAPPANKKAAKQAPASAPKAKAEAKAEEGAEAPKRPPKSQQKAQEKSKSPAPAKVAPGGDKAVKGEDSAPAKGAPEKRQEPAKDPAKDPATDPHGGPHDDSPSSTSLT